MAKQQEKKKFYQVQVPLLKKEVELYGRESQLKGRHVKLDLTNSLKGKGLEIKFIVEESEGQLVTRPKQAYLQGFYIRRMLRKGTDYVEDSFLTESKDHRIRVKPFMITRKRVSREVLNGLRIKAKEEITKYTKDKTFEEIVKDIMEGTLQKKILPPLKKIYPLGLCEIRFIGIEDLKEHERYEEQQKAEEEKTEVKEVETKEEKKE
tara:strand:+ start:864 stop:1484 length:621 start_codon:yes stop_codon:yes gene_type:complete